MSADPRQKWNTASKSPYFFPELYWMDVIITSTYKLCLLDSKMDRLPVLSYKNTPSLTIYSRSTFRNEPQSLFKGWDFIKCWHFINWLLLCIIINAALSTGNTTAEKSKLQSHRAWSWINYFNCVTASYTLNLISTLLRCKKAFSYHGWSTATCTKQW